MKKDYTTKKKITIAALSLTAVCLAVGLFYYVGTLNNAEPPASPVETQPPVQSEVVVPEIIPESATTEDVTDHSGATDSKPSVDGDVQAKPSDDKPKTPAEATPPTEKPMESEEAPIENPNSGGECQPEQKPKPDTNAPQSGDKRSDGAIYMPGFGWIEDEGENTQIEGDFDITGEKVGDM